MSRLQRKSTRMPSEQLGIRAKCFPPAGLFADFRTENAEQSLPDRFEQQVSKYPHQIAVKTRSHQLTYDELNKSANRLARAILAQREAGEEPIALLLEGGVPMISAVFGVLKSGKFYVSIDPSFSHEGVTNMTGALGCIRPDGCLVHLGWKDTRGKTGGYLVRSARAFSGWCLRQLP